MARIYIVQHCQAEHHLNEFTGGWSDTALTELGKEQAVKCAEELERLGLSEDFELVSSDLLRTRMTAQAIEEKFNVKMKLNEILREHNNGAAANKTKEWAKNNKLYNSDKMELDKQAWEGAETFRELYNRMKEVTDTILANPEKDLVIVSHGVAIGYLVMAYLNFDCDSIVDSILRGKAGGISILTTNRLNQKSLNMFGSISHLA